MSPPTHRSCCGAPGHAPAPEGSGQVQGDQNPEGTDSEGAGWGGGEALNGLGAEGGGRPARRPAPNLGSLGERLVQRPRMVRRTAVHDLGVGVAVGPFPSVEAPRGPAEAPGAPPPPDQAPQPAGAQLAAEPASRRPQGGGLWAGACMRAPSEADTLVAAVLGFCAPGCCLEARVLHPPGQGVAGRVAASRAAAASEATLPWEVGNISGRQSVEGAGTPREKIRPGCDDLPAAKNHDVHQEPLYQPQCSDPGLTS